MTQNNIVLNMELDHYLFLSIYLSLSIDVSIVSQSVSMTIT